MIITSVFNLYFEFCYHVVEHKHKSTIGRNFLTIKHTQKMTEGCVELQKSAFQLTINKNCPISIF